MRDVIIIIIILIVVVMLNIFVNKYLKDTAKSITTRLDKIELMLKSNDTKNIMEEAKLIQEEWDIVSKKWAIMVEHQEIDKIDMELKRIKTFFEQNELDNGTISLNVIKYFLIHITELYRWNIVNIF